MKKIYKCSNNNTQILKFFIKIYFINNSKIKRNKTHTHNLHTNNNYINMITKISILIKIFIFFFLFEICQSIKLKNVDYAEIVN